MYLVFALVAGTVDGMLSIGMRMVGCRQGQQDRAAAQESP
jgi:hypothetical protein